MSQQIIEYSFFSHYSGTYFNLTKVNQDDVFYFWSDFAKGKNCVDEKTKLGASAFWQALEYYDRSDVWVAYMSNRASAHYKGRIEMAVTVTIGDLHIKDGGKIENSFSSHMGIFRNLDYDGSKHSKSSMELHGFAAKAISELYPNIKFMINFPMENMLKIMRDKAQETGKVCSSYQKETNAHDNEIQISSDNGELQFQHGEDFYAVKNDGWFFKNPCLYSQLANALPVAIMPIVDLAGCSSFADTPIIEEF